MVASPSPSERIVAVGLLTQRDVEVLGIGFRRLFPVESNTAFAELLRKLDCIEAQAHRGPDEH